MSNADSISVKDVRLAALNLLARREHSFYELVEKLARKFPPELATTVATQLQQDNLQNDERFVESFVRYRSLQGKGPLRIKLELRQKGIADALIQQQLNSDEYDWFELAKELYQRKFHSHVGFDSSSVNPIKIDQKEKAKRLRFLAYRGFNGEQSAYAMQVIDD